MSETTCVLYCRVSPATGRSNDGASLETQEADLRAYTVANGWKVRGVVAGIESGAASLEDRKHLARAIAMVEPGDVLVVAKWDRLARDLFLHLTIEDTLKREGIRLHCAGEPLEETPELALQRSIFAAFAQYERARIRLRTMRGKRESMENGGHWGGKAPFGLCWVDGAAELVPAELECVRQILRAHAAGKSNADIMASVASPRARKGGSGKLHSTTVAAIIRGDLDPRVLAEVGAA